MKKIILFFSIIAIKNLSAQNVGIGTSTPIGAINIFNPDSSILNFHNTSTGSTSADGFFIGNLGSTIAQVWNKENAGIRFGTNNQERLIITGSGNVGIGFSGPTYRLSVNGTIYSSGMFVDGTLTVDGNITTNNGAGIVRSNDANQLAIDEYVSGANINWNLDPGESSCCIGINFTTFAAPPSIAFGRLLNTTNPGNIALTINSITNSSAQIRATNIGNQNSTAVDATLNAMIIGRK